MSQDSGNDRQRYEIDDDDERRHPMVGHLVRRGIPILILALVIAGAIVFWRRANVAPKHEPAAAPQGPVPVSVMTVRNETVPIQMKFLGQTEGSVVVEIRARVAGYLQGRTFKEGDRVEKGQKLFQIDPRPFEVELSRAKAQLASAQATLRRAQAQVKRYQELAQRQSATPSELEDWQTQEMVAAALIEQHKAEIESAELQLSYTSIEAPVTGMIGRALKDVGSYVDSGQNGLLAVIQQVDPIYVRFSVTEQEVLRFRRQVAAGEIAAPAVEAVELQITLSDGTTYPHKGRINFVDVQVDQTTGTSIVRGQVPNPDGLLKPGQFIYATVLGIERINVVRVPQDAVLHQPSGDSVLVVNDKNVVESRPVVLGEWSGTSYWVVEQGLQSGDRVITSRVMTLRPGMPVTVAAAEAPTAPNPAQASANGAPAAASNGGK